MESSLNDWTNPPSIEIVFKEEDKDRILGYIISIGSSFPSEISRHLLIDISRVNGILIHMVNEGKIERLIPNEIYPQPLIKCCIMRMWGQGVFGFKEFI